MASEKDSRAISPSHGAQAGYGHESSFARRCLCHRLGTCCADVEAVLSALAAALIEAEGHIDPALASIVQELTLGRRNLANAVVLATQRL